MTIGHNNPPPRRDTLTDMGNAQRMARMYGDKLRYAVEVKAWLLWKDSRWEKVPDIIIEGLAKKVVLSIYNEAPDAANPIAAGLVAKHAKQSEAQVRIRAMVDSLKSEAGIPLSTSQLDRAPMLLNVQNGTLNLATGELQPHRREDYITKICPISYDPAANCPLWEQFIERIFLSDTSLIEYVQKALGYCLTGETREQVLFFLIGNGANGKSTLLVILQHILGDYAQQAPSDLLSIKIGNHIPADIARLQGARTVILTEMDRQKAFAEATVKQLTGGDKIAARLLYGNFFEFHPQCKLLIAANHNPGIKGSDEGIWRRIRKIPFNVSIPEEERDKHLGDKLRQESAGILNWMLAGCLKWQQEGLEPPASVQEASRHYREEVDIVSRFISECCQTDHAAIIRATALYQAFREWAGASAIEQQEFGTRLSQLGFEGKRKSGHISRLGLTLRASEVTGEGQQED